MKLVAASKPQMRAGLKIAAPPRRPATLTP